MRNANKRARLWLASNPIPVFAGWMKSTHSKAHSVYYSITVDNTRLALSGSRLVVQQKYPFKNEYLFHGFEEKG
jgi:hypothetical protein